MPVAGGGLGLPASSVGQQWRGGEPPRAARGGSGNGARDWGCGCRPEAVVLVALNGKVTFGWPLVSDREGFRPPQPSAFDRVQP